MAISEGTRAIFRDLAFEAATVIGARIESQLEKAVTHLEKRQDDALELHAAQCPTTKKVDATLTRGRASWQTLVLIVAILAWLTSTAIAIWK